MNQSQLFEHLYLPLADVAEELFQTVQSFYQQGWAPATSTNYSLRASDEYIFISRTGLDKSKFKLTQPLVLIDKQGKVITPESARPSAETALHLLLYENPACNVVLHIHSIAATVLSRYYFEDLQQDRICLGGWELLKGLRGVDTHETQVYLPIFQNAQDIPQLAADIRPCLQKQPDTFGFLLAGHGLYIWGNDLSEARRHTETFQFLLESELKIHLLRATKG